MQIPTVAQLIPILQTAVGPVILISGIGLLLLTMTNRLGRVIDRVRILSDILVTASDETHKAIDAQLRILWRRARLIRTSIALASTSALAAAILIIALFFTALWQLPTAIVVASLFVICMLCLIASLIIFIHDVNQSLTALKLELEIDGLKDI
jgi:Protein of unknown function (DUF2721)